jgi:hypothetical protein
MKIHARFTKSALENEEGMTHLWIRLTPIGSVEKVRLQLSMPPGIYRHSNLSGFEEMDTGEILIPNSMMENDLVLELFTREPVHCGEKTLIVTVSYWEMGDSFVRVEQYVPIRVVAEDEIDNIVIDDEVVTYVQSLLKLSPSQEGYEYRDYSNSRIIRLGPNKYSELEKKYRIEGELR